MLYNYIKRAARNLRLSPGYSALNIAGLALGIACCLLITLWVRDEMSFDNFHTKSERIYRVNKVHTPPAGNRELHALSPGPMAPALVDDFPEIEAAVRVLPWWGEILLGQDENRIPVPDVVFADANLFQVFDFQLLRGDPARALEDPLSIVLSKGLSEAIFGREDPVGQTIIGQNDLTYTVTGVVEDSPGQSHLRYNAFVSWSTVVPDNDALNFEWLTRWLPQTLFTYVLLRPDAHAASLAAKLPDFVQRHFPERAEQYSFYLQPLETIYLQSTDVLYLRSTAQGNQSYVYILSIVAIMVLLIACVNFVNLATARAGRRAVEVGVRKTIGASRKQLVVQFLSEAFLLVFIGLGIALVVAEALLPLLNDLAGKQLLRFSWAEPSVVALLVALGLVVGLGAGLYPAMVLSRFQPSRVLKGKASVGGKRFREVLVTSQFAISIALIAGTVVVYQQMQFVQSSNPGYDREQIVILPIGPTDIADQFDAFKTEILRNPDVTNATGTNSVPGSSFSTFGFHPEGRPRDEGLTAAALLLHDDDLIETYGMKLVEGRFFDTNRPADTSAVVINEAMLRSLGWTDAVGKRFDIPGDVEEGTIIGVVKDFQLASMHQEIAPLFMIVQPRSGSMSVRISNNDIASTLAHLQAAWERFESRYPFEYRFLDDSFAQLYQADRRMMQTLGIFAAIAILVACMGLFGLAAFTAEQRTKEIGVRKVMGASIRSIVALMSKDFARLVIVGFIVAAPVAYFGASRWLEAFAYRITISWWMIVAAGISALAIALITVSYHAFRVALADPVNSLRYE